MAKITNLASAAQQYNVQKNETKKELEKKPVQQPVQQPVQKGKTNTKTAVATFVGSSIGIVASIALLLHKLKKGDPNIKFSNLQFAEKDVLKIGAASVLGGLTGGIQADKKENITAKLKEANIQFFGNILTPVSVLMLNNKIFKPDSIKMPQFKKAAELVKQSSQMNADEIAKLGSKLTKAKGLVKVNSLLKGVPRIAITIASLTAGLSLGNKIMNKVNEKIFNEKSKREVKPSDFSAHIDDLCFASTFFFKNPAIKSVMSKILPATFLIAGMETGTKTKD